MPYCTKCGNAVKPAASFCNRCGRPTPRAVPGPVARPGVAGDAWSVPGWLLVAAILLIAARPLDFAVHRLVWLAGFGAETIIAWASELFR
jgi:zinc-ribbon domain